MAFSWIDIKYNFDQDDFSPKQCYLKDEKTKEISDKNGVISGAKGCGMYTEQDESRH